MRPVNAYRRLLWCYPAEFRREYGPDMIGAFREQLREARSTGRWAVLAVCVRTLADLIPTAIREHRHVMHQDLRHAFRALASQPGFTVVAILSLALGIGANTAIFSLLDSVVFATLPVRDAGGLVLLTDPSVSGVSIGMQDGERALLTYAEFRQLQEQGTAFTSLMASSSALQRVDARVSGGEAEELAVRLVSSSYFDTLGVPAVVGRTFDASSEPAAGTAPLAVISYEFWQRRFGGRRDVLGRTIALRSGVLSIIGVAPASFFGETVGERPDAWVPLAMQATIIPGREWLRDRPGDVEKVMWLHAFGRLRPGIDAARAQAGANAIFQRGLTAYYGTLPDPEMRREFLNQRLRLRPAASGASSIRDEFSQPLLVLLAAAALVLLIACANLANLLLARTTARARDIAVRIALGASRGRLIRHLLAESVCLAAAGGAAGLVAALAMRQGLLRLAGTVPIALPGAIDPRTLAFAFALTVIAALLLGLLPALRLTRAGDTVARLHDGGRGIAGSATWLRVGRFVVIAQLALSLPLLVGAGLLVRTLGNLQSVDLGFPREGLLTARVDARAAGYDEVRQTAAFERVLARLRAIPGVKAATYSNNGLFGGSDNGDAISVEGYTPSGRGDRGSRYDAVGPRYFSTVGIPIRLGREITEDDGAAGRMICVINEAFARRFFKGRNPLGLHVTQQYANEHHTYEIVGVAADVRSSRLRGEIEHRFYTPAARPAAQISAVSFLVRPAGGAGNLAGAVRRAVQQAEPSMPVSQVRTLDEAIDSRIVQDRLLARLSAAFGVVALLLTAVGLYGVLSYGVARRTSELGLRKALGARDTMLIRLVVRETGWLLAVGLGLGAVLSAASIRLIASRLYGLAPTDPATLTSAVVGLAAVGLLATGLPAYRASRVDPLVALRQE